MKIDNKRASHPGRSNRKITTNNFSAWREQTAGQDKHLNLSSKLSAKPQASAFVHHGSA